MTYDKLESKAAIDPQLPVYQTMEETVKALSRGEKAFYVSGAMAAPLFPEEKVEWKKKRDRALFRSPFSAVAGGFLFGVIGRIAMLGKHSGEYTRGDLITIMLAGAALFLCISLCSIGLIFRPWQSHIRIRLSLYLQLDIDKRRALYSTFNDIDMEEYYKSRMERFLIKPSLFFLSAKSSIFPLPFYSIRQEQEGMWLMRNIHTKIMAFFFLIALLFSQFISFLRLLTSSLSSA